MDAVDAVIGVAVVVLAGITLVALSSSPLFSMSCRGGPCDDVDGNVGNEVVCVGIIQEYYSTKEKYRYYTIMMSATCSVLHIDERWRRHSFD